MGQALAALGLGTLLYCTMRIRTSGFLDARVILSLILAVVSLLLFIFVEKRSVNPVLPLDFFHNESFSCPVLIGIFISASYTGMLFLLSLYLQRGLKYSPLETGLAFIPLTATLPVANIACGRLLDRFGPGVPIAVGALLAAIGLSCMTVLGDRSTIHEMLIGFLLLPAGMGLVVPALAASILASVGQEWSGTASAVLNAARQIGGALGVAGFGTLVSGGGDSAIRAMPVAAVIGALLFMAALAAALVMRRGEQGRSRGTTG